VPVRNEGACIERLLEQLLSQHYDSGRFEVLVADGCSTDGTVCTIRRLQARFPNLRLLDNPHYWSSAGRNVAIRAAEGDLLVVIDGHCEVDNTSYLKDLAEVFAQSGADCIGRPQPLDMSETTRLQRAIAAARSSGLGHNPSSYIYSTTEQFVRPQSVAVAYRRAVFERVGLFDESFDACEDVEFNHRVERAGFRCFFTPRAGVRYHPRSSLCGLFHQMARYGRGRVRLLRKFPETFTFGCFLPAAFVLAIVFGPALAWFGPWGAAAYGGLVGLYAAAVALTSLGIVWRTREAGLLPWLPLAFLAIHVGAGVGILREAIFGWRAPSGSCPEMAATQLPAGVAAEMKNGQ
jgi:succinoglycan biosynthesis protein ExoA